MQPYEHPPRRQGWSARRSLTVLAALGIAVSTCVAAADTAQALAPANDNFADRIAITKDTPISVSFAEATIEPTIDGEAALAACGFDVLAAFPNQQTLWFDFTPTVAESVGVQFDGGGFINGAVVTGDPGSFTGTTCSLPPFFDVTPGVTYHIGVADLLGSSSTTTMSIVTAAPAPTISATLETSGVVDQVNNLITLNGTYTCTSAAPTAVTILGDVQQNSGPFFVSAYVLTTIEPAICDGTPHAWSGQTNADPNGLFRAAPVTVRVDTVTACNPRCSDASIPATTVRLKSVNGTPNPPAVAPSPTPMKFTVDRSPVLDRATNVVTLSGTFSCNGGDEAFVTGRIRQVANNGIFVFSYLDADLGQCTGSTQRWTATAVQLRYFGDLLAGGPATFDAVAYSCSIDGVCGNDAPLLTTLSIKAVGEKAPKGATPGILPLPAGVAVNFDRRAVLDRTNNSVTVTGRIVCSNATDVTLLNTEVDQLVGRVHIRGFGFPFEPIACGPIPQQFSFRADGSNGRFSPGKAVTMAAFAFSVTSSDGVTSFFDVGIAPGDLRLAEAKPKK